MEPNGKLVRDRIPEIIEAAGEVATVRRLGAAERLPALLDKLQEESDELRAAATDVERTEELADVIEVLRGIADQIGIDWAHVEDLRATKRAARGGFSQGIWLVME